jgi:hypothetical protein
MNEKNYPEGTIVYKSLDDLREKMKQKEKIVQEIMGEAGTLYNGVTGPGQTGIIGGFEESYDNKGIGYTGLQDLVEKAKANTLSHEDLMFYSGEEVKRETEEQRSLRKEIENLSEIWLMDPLTFSGDKVRVKTVANLMTQQVIAKKEKFTFKKVREIISNIIINFGKYLKEKRQYQKDRIIKILVKCKRCKGLGFKKKIYSKKYDKGTEEYKKTFIHCKHCMGNGRIVKDISKKDVASIGKLIKGKRHLIDGPISLYF